MCVKGRKALLVGVRGVGVGGWEETPQSTRKEKVQTRLDVTRTAETQLVSELERLTGTGTELGSLAPACFGLYKCPYGFQASLYLF